MLTLETVMVTGVVVGETPLITQPALVLLTKETALLLEVQTRSLGRAAPAGVGTTVSAVVPSAGTVASPVMAMAVAAAFVTEPVNMLLPEMSPETKAMMEMLLNGPVWIVLLSVSVFAPFFEEWLCRGIILRGLLRKVGPTWAIVISAAVFGLIHGNIWQAIPAFLIGCLLGYVYYKTGSLKLTMLMHCVNNTLAVVFSRIPGLEDVEFLAEIMSPWAYILVLVAFAVTLVSGLVTISSARSSESSLPTSSKVIS